MINIHRDETSEINTDVVSIPAKLTLTPALDSDCKIFLIYLLYYGINFPDARFNWTTFQVRTGIARRRSEKIKNALTKLGIIEVQSGLKKTIIDFDFTALMNFLNKPVTRKKAWAKNLSNDLAMQLLKNRETNHVNIDHGINNQNVMKIATQPLPLFEQDDDDNVQDVH